MASSFRVSSIPMRRSMRNKMGRDDYQRRRRRIVRGTSIKMKVRKLQRLVPGGRSLEPDRLFLQTANYILHLKFQVNVLQALSNLYKP